MKDKVNVVFSKEQYDYLHTVLERIIKDEENSLSALASGVMGNLLDCSHPNNSPTPMLPECVVSEFYNDNAADVIICLLNECAKLEKQACVEKEVPVASVSDALEMVMSKAKEMYGDEIELEDNPIVAAFDNCTVIIGTEEQNLKVHFSGDIPLKISAKVDAYIPDKP